MYVRHCEFFECFSNVFCRGLNEEIRLNGVRLCIVFCDNDVDSVWRVSRSVGQGEGYCSFEIGDRIDVGRVDGEYQDVCSSGVHGEERSVALLTSGVPDIKRSVVVCVYEVGGSHRRLGRTTPLHEGVD